MLKLDKTSAYYIRYVYAVASPTPADADAASLSSATFPLSVTDRVSVGGGNHCDDDYHRRSKMV